MFIQLLIYMEIKENKIIVKIPITGATSKIRIKRRKDNFGEPISVINNTFSDKDYLEWQISYFLPFDTIWDSFRKAKTLEDKKEIFNQLFYYYKDPELYEKLRKFIVDNQNTKKADFKKEIRTIFEQNKETIIKKVHKNDKEYVSYELSDMFEGLFEANIITKKEIEELMDYNKEDILDIEKDYNVKRETTDKILKKEFEFLNEKAPLLILNINDTSFVEMILQHKQRAVGYQCMIYFGVYMSAVKDSNGNSVIGRTAKSKEEITVEISKEHLLGIAKSFIVASEEHAWDMKKILKEILNKNNK